MKFSEEMINAYADGELQGSEKAEFEQVLMHDAELQQSVEKVMALKSSIKQAYADIELPVEPVHKPVNYAVAAYVLFLLLGFSGGWLSSGLVTDPVATSHDVGVDSGIANVEQAEKYILHIGSHDVEKFKHVLDKAETLVSRYQDDLQLIELEIIANANGLDLFRESASPYAQRVKQLSNKYPNIKFIACTNAIERLREKGIEPDLINAVHQGPTALDQVVKRMNQGWTYIKI